MAWYRAGSVTVTNGSAVVTGAGTDFVANASVGEAFLGPDARVYEIAQVVSATQLVLSAVYQGAGAGGQGYAVLPTQSFARDLASGVASLLTRYGGIADGVGAGLFSDGGPATPAIRFGADQDTGIYRYGANAIGIATGGARCAVFNNGRFGIGTDNPDSAFDVSASAPVRGIIGRFRNGDSNGTGAQNVMWQEGVATWAYGQPAGANAFAWWSGRSSGTDGTEVMRLTNSGNLGIGTINPGAKLHVRAGQDQNVVVLTNAYGSAPGVVAVASVTDTSALAPLAIMGSDVRFYNGGSEAARITGGNLLVGSTTSYPAHNIGKLVGEGDLVLAITNAAFGYTTAAYYSCGVTILGSGASCAMAVSRNSGTQRSINAGGTINASGADYAEYMLKAAGCGRIPKGDICGVDHDGRLTKTWADAISFVVKSTDPSLVGGDTWDAAVGPRPEQPGAEPVAPASPLEPADGADDAERETWAAAIADHPAQVEAYHRAHAEWQAAMDAHAEAMTVWGAAHEQARQCVDRIAFCGQVPVNVAGEFAVGDYIIAASNGAGIQAIAIAEAEITFDQYRRRIGKVWAVRDGRAWVDVQHG